jgi:hypothetical protein
MVRRSARRRLSAPVAAVLPAGFARRELSSEWTTPSRATLVSIRDGYELQNRAILANSIPRCSSLTRLYQAAPAPAPAPSASRARIVHASASHSPLRSSSSEPALIPYVWHATGRCSTAASTKQDGTERVRLRRRPTSGDRPSDDGLGWLARGSVAGIASGANRLPNGASGSSHQPPLHARPVAVITGGRKTTRGGAQTSVDVKDAAACTYAPRFSWQLAG